MAQERRHLRGESFAFETTLAGLGYARQIRIWREAGYRVELFFLSLPTPEAAILRVAERVRQGNGRCGTTWATCPFFWIGAET
jgi:predicted ABC-type ATPase